MIRVLLVEDMVQTQELIVEVLRFIGGFQIVGTARSEMAATEWLEKHPGGCDLAIVDLMLREGTGFGPVRRFSEAGGAEVIVFSDFASPAVAEKCRSFGAAEVIPKSDYRQLRSYLEDFRGRRVNEGEKIAA